MTEAPKRIWIDVDQIIMGYEDDPQHVSPEDAEYILAAEHERLMAEARRDALDEAAKLCDDEAISCDDAVKWGGRSRRYLQDCKAAAYAMRDRAAAIRALAEKE